MEPSFSVLFEQSQHIPLESRMYWDLKLSQTYFQGHHHLWSQAVDPLLAQTKFIHLVYSQMGHRSTPCQFGHLLWLGINAQTLLKAEIADHEPAGRKKAFTQTLSKSLLMFKTYQNSQYSLVALIIPIWLWNADTLSSDLNRVFILPWSDKLSSLSRLNMTRSVLLKCLPVVTFPKINLWSSSCNSRTLASDLPLESYLTSLYKRRCVCSTYSSSQSCTNRHELRACT